MTDAVRRFLTAHAIVTNGADAEPREYPDVFTGTAALISEIDEALVLARVQTVQLLLGRMKHNIAHMSEAALHLEILLRQSHAMTQTLHNILEFHRLRLSKSEGKS